jgi:putative proteasome-type protease
MTYCLGMLLEDGLVFGADSRTNAGVDHIATFRKLTVFERPGERVMVLLSAGSLATTQSVVSLVSERLGARKGEDSLYKSSTMFNAARIVGRALREIIDADEEYVRGQGADPSASFILGGQIKGRPPRLFQIYGAGNFIEATPETPFLQIGETKYGKPILDRVLTHQTPIGAATKCALLSLDSTMRSNLSVGPPLDILCYPRDSFSSERQYQIADDDPYFTQIRQRYSQGIQELFDRLPEPEWSPEAKINRVAAGK